MSFDFVPILFSHLIDQVKKANPIQNQQLLVQEQKQVFQKVIPKPPSVELLSKVSELKELQSQDTTPDSLKSVLRKIREKNRNKIK